jgi:hypothetical protein
MRPLKTTTAKKSYICFRCKEIILAGEEYYFSQGSKTGTCYRYHPICKSISGKKESYMTENLSKFIEAVEEGPKLVSEFPMIAQNVSPCYQKATMMGIHVYRTEFSTPRSTNTIYYLHKHRRLAWKRMLEIAGDNIGATRYYQLGRAVLGEEINKRRKWG